MLSQQLPRNPANAKRIRQGRLASSRHGANLGCWWPLRVNQQSSIKRRRSYPFRNQWHHARVASSSSRLALRASVLRRAVSLATRPMLRCWPSSVTVGRDALQHHRSSQSVAGLCMSSSKLFPKSLQCSTLSCGANLPHAKTLRPNHSLNRTHCGMRPKARHFILGL